ncbi:hypothetical protein GALMADRAFT_251042 [Galerina marginata CBS 339.88]|uniref:Uncharacterized protein n=1 Tax=Galerina marginata (strain CBS 339.88) TaxID=685588 RepID=A0A067ST85_GALM3|nr:hypothetical protein GALMADRAFT_251042 [Galerina marginata CBS 339.88]
MPFPFALATSSKGEVYSSTYDSLITHQTPPTTPLSQQHPFRSLWAEHFQSLYTPGIFDSVIDAFLAILRGSPNRVKSDTPSYLCYVREEVRKRLRDIQPNGVVLDMTDDSCYYRVGSLHFICIRKQLVDLWIAAQRHSATSPKTLALTAILKTLIDRELGRWFCAMKMGKYIAEIRYYVEVHSRGGIMTYSGGKAYLETGKNRMHSLPTSYLNVYYSPSRFTQCSTSTRPTLFYTPPSPFESFTNEAERAYRAGEFFPPEAQVPPPRRSHCERRICGNNVVRQYLESLNK